MMMRARTDTVVRRLLVPATTLLKPTTWHVPGVGAVVAGRLLVRQAGAVDGVRAVIARAAIRGLGAGRSRHGPCQKQSGEGEINRSHVGVPPGRRRLSLPLSAAGTDC